MTLTTLCFAKLASPFSRRTLPGDLASLRLDVNSADDYCVDTAAIEQVVLDHDMWVPEARFRAGRLLQGRSSRYHLD